jgi:hypothetical protein
MDWCIVRRGLASGEAQQEATMLLEITEIHPAESAKLLNTEWFVVHNVSDKPFSTRGCTLIRTRKNSKKSTALGTMDPGFSLAPGESVRVVTGNPGRKAHGKPPEDDIKTYNLFLGGPILKGSGTVLLLKLRSNEVARVEFDPSADKNVAST